MKKKFFTKDKIFLMIFLLCLFVCRSILAVWVGYASMYGDEVIHWGTSKSIYQSGQTIIRNIPANWFSNLYSVCISWVHAIKDYELQYNVARIFNVFMMMLGLLPFYKLSSRVLQDKTRVTVLVVLVACLPEFVYSVRILQENLFFPVLMWMYLYIYKTFEDDDIHIKNILVLSAFSFVSFWTRTAGICVLLTIASSFFCFALMDRKIEEYLEKMAMLILGFMALNSFTRWIYHMVNPDIMDYSIGTEIASRFSFENIPAWIQGGFKYLLIFIIVTGVFSVIISLLSFSRFPKALQRFAIFTGFLLAYAIIESVCMFWVPENMQRVHFRYIFFLIPPILLIFFFSCKLQGGEFSFSHWKRWILAGYVFLCAILLFAVGCFSYAGSSIDCGSNRFLVENNIFLYRFVTEGQYKTLIIIGLLVYMIIMFFLIFKSKRLFMYLFLAYTIFFLSLNNGICYLIEYKSKEYFMTTVAEDYSNINAYIEENLKESDSIAYMAENYTGDQLELHVSHNLYYIALDYLKSIVDSKGELPDNKMIYIGWEGAFSWGTPPEYIICHNELPIKLLSYHMIYEGDYYCIYEKTEELFNCSIG